MEKNRGSTQYCPGTTIIAQNCRKVIDSKVKLDKLREVPMNDIVLLLGHRSPGETIPSIHPPLNEVNEPDCPIRELVEPTPGAKAGERLNYVQITDAYHFSPGSPYPRARKYFSRYRGVDLGVLTTRVVIEMRESELEQLVKDELESETFDPARSTLKGITTHGVATRLDQDGLLFDSLRRIKYNKVKKIVQYEKNQLGVPLDRPIPVGKPASDEELKKRALQYHALNIKYSEEVELHKAIERMWELSMMMGNNPDLTIDK